MTVLDIVVRLSNALVTVLGLTLLSYGGYLAATCKVIANPVTEASLGLGVIDMVFGLLVLTCGYRNLFILRLYGLIMSILVVAEFVLAVLFLTNNSIVISNSATCGDDKAMSLAKTNLSWIILAVAACQTVTLIIVFLQVCNVDKVSGSGEELVGGAGGWLAIALTHAHTHTHTHTYTCTPHTPCSPLMRASTMRRAC